MPTYQNVTPIQLGQAAITTSATTLYTVPSLTRTYLKDINICNTTGSPVTVNVYLVPSGGSAGTGNALLYGLSVAANTVYSGLAFKYCCPVRLFKSQQAEPVAPSLQAEVRQHDGQDTTIP